MLSLYVLRELRYNADNSHTSLLPVMRKNCNQLLNGSTCLGFELYRPKPKQVQKRVSFFRHVRLCTKVKAYNGCLTQKQHVTEAS